MFGGLCLPDLRFGLAVTLLVRRCCAFARSFVPPSLPFLVGFFLKKESFLLIGVAEPFLAFPYRLHSCMDDIEID
jgi:hypothetical protein